MTRLGDVTSMAEHQNNLKAHLQSVKETGRPMFVTTDGETVAVVLSPATFDELMDQAELASSQAMVAESFEDIKAGRTYDAEQSIEEIAAEFGLTLERRPARK